MVIEGPFYKFNEAAKYCGYTPGHFRRLLREKSLALPRTGPGKGRYAKSVLDAFMAYPDAFCEAVSKPARLRAPLLVSVKA